MLTSLSDFFDGKKLDKPTLSVEEFASGDAVNADILTRQPLSLFGVN